MNLFQNLYQSRLMMQPVDFAEDRVDMQKAPNATNVLTLAQT